MPNIYSIFEPILLRLQLTQQTLLQWLQNKEIQTILPEVEKQLKDLLDHLVDHFLQKLKYKYENGIDPGELIELIANVKELNKSADFFPKIDLVQLKQTNSSDELNEAVGKIIDDFFRSTSKSNPNNKISLKNRFQVLNYLNKIFHLLEPSKINEGNKLIEKFQVLNHLNDEAIFYRILVYHDELTNNSQVVSAIEIQKETNKDFKWYLCSNCYEIIQETKSPVQKRKSPRSTCPKCSTCFKPLNSYEENVTILEKYPKDKSLGLTEQLKFNHILIGIKSRIILEISLINKQITDLEKEVRFELHGQLHMGSSSAISASSEVMHFNMDDSLPSSSPASLPPQQRPSISASSASASLRPEELVQLHLFSLNDNLDEKEGPSLQSYYSELRQSIDIFETQTSASISASTKPVLGGTIEEFTLPNGTTITKVTPYGQAQSGQDNNKIDTTM